MNVLIEKSSQRFRNAMDNKDGSKNFWQAGKSVAGISKIEPAGDIVKKFESALSAIS